MARGWVGLFAALGVAFSGAARAACSLTPVAQLPISMEALRAITPVQINGQEVKLMVDTGAAFSGLSPEAARKLGLKPSAMGDDLWVEGAGGAANLSVVGVDQLTVGGFTVTHSDFFVHKGADLGGVPGLLGENILGHFDAEYDFADGVLRFMVAAGCGSRALTYWDDKKPYGVADLAPNLDDNNRQILISGQVNGAKMRIVMDSGAPLSVLTAAAAKRAGLSLSGPDVAYEGPGGGIGYRRYKVWVVPVASLDLGGEQIRNTKLRVGDFASEQYDMLLGADFSLSHRIYVSQGQRRVYFTYNGGPVFILDGVAGGH